MTNWKKIKKISSNTKGKTIKHMEIYSSYVEIDFTDNTKIKIDFDYDEGDFGGFSVDVEEKI